jgi:hypothetical protein
MKQDWHPEELALHWTLSESERELLGTKTDATRLSSGAVDGARRSSCVALARMTRIGLGAGSSTSRIAAMIPTPVPNMLTILSSSRTSTGFCHSRRPLWSHLRVNVSSSRFATLARWAGDRLLAEIDFADPDGGTFTRLKTKARFVAPRLSFGTPFLDHDRRTTILMASS